MAQQSSHPMQTIAMRFEVIPEEMQQLDISDIDEVGQELIDELRNNGYSVNPAYTGKKGGPVYDILLQIPQFLHDNRELLLAIFDSIALTLHCVLLVRDRRTEREKERRAPLEFTLELDGKPITITVHNAESGVKLLESFQKAYPEETKKLTSTSSIKARAKVPKKKRRRSH